MMRDDRRAEVYAAEVAAFDGTDLEAARPFEVIAAIIDEVVGGAWWPGPLVRVVAARSDSTTSSTRCCEGESTIRFAVSQLTVATAAHELAHALAGPEAGHSPVFLAAYLDVIAVMTNLEPGDRRHELHVGQLRAALAAVGLTAGPRAWPAPPESIGTAIAL